MDPKLSNLDPKLQDAYNRVMGGSVNNTTTPQQPNQTPPSSQEPPLQSSPTQTPPPPTTAQNQPYQTSQSQEQQTSATAPAYPPPPTDPDPGITPPSQFTENTNPNPYPNGYKETPPDILSQSAQAPIVSSPAPDPEKQTLPDETPPPSTPIDETPGPSASESTISTAPAQAAMPSSSSTIAFNAENSSKNIGTTPVKKGGLNILPLVVGLGVILLLLAYTFVWILIFNVELPFLPAF